MKKVLLLALIFWSYQLSAQRLPDFGFEKVRIVEDGKVIQAEVKTVESTVHPKATLFYSWYGANTIHVSQGGFSGKLLNGNYNEFYFNKNLKVQGVYKNGLKNGPWKSWKDDGNLVAVENWKHGVLLKDTVTTFWSKLLFFKKWKKQSKKNAPTT